MIRVFPRRTNATPTDELSFVGDPPLFLPPKQPVRVSITFNWDLAEGERLARSWARYFPDVQAGGPAYGDPGDEFVPGRFVKEGMVFTSRGCPGRCAHCFIPAREGAIREVPIRDGWDICDNNLLACSRSHVEAVFDMLSRQNRRPRFSGGIEAARLERWSAQGIPPLNPSCVWTAYDRPEQRGVTEKAIDTLRSYGLTRRQVGCYILIGTPWDTLPAAEARLREAWNWGALPFAMLYRGPKDHHREIEWRRLQRRWCRPAVMFSAIQASLIEEPAMQTEGGDDSARGA